MEPAIREGDWLLVDPTTTRWPRRGSVVAFHEPDGGALAIKRVAGTARRSRAVPRRLPRAGRRRGLARRRRRRRRRPPRPASASRSTRNRLRAGAGRAPRRAGLVPLRPAAPDRPARTFEPWTNRTSDGTVTSPDPYPLEGTICRDFDALAPPDHRARAAQLLTFSLAACGGTPIGRHVGADLGRTREPRTIRWDREPISRSVGLGLGRSEPRRRPAASRSPSRASRSRCRQAGRRIDLQSGDLEQIMAAAGPTTPRWPSSIPRRSRPCSRVVS